MIFIENQNGKQIILNGFITVRCSKDGWIAKFPSSCIKEMVTDFQEKHSKNSFELNIGNSPIPESKL